MSIRSATGADVDAVRRVARRSWETDYEDVLTRETATEAVDDWYDPDRIGAELDDDRTLLLVAERTADGEEGEERTVVGFAHATWNEETAEGYILRLYTHPDHRREGVGRALLERTRDELSGRGVERVNAMVLAANDPGAAFYERFGFGFVDERETTIGDESYPESRYALDLDTEADGR
jgi:ribosomal protein S18 acetylase RimI-like enzyme